MLTDSPARTEQGYLKRVSDLRNEIPIISSQNFGFVKGKALEQSRFVYDKTCLFCGTHFQGIATAKYDSEACKQKAKRLRQKS